MSRARRRATRAPGGSTLASTSESAPSRARTNPACRLRTRWARPAINGSELPARMDGDDAAGQRPMRDPPEAGVLDHPCEGVGRREAADGFHEILVRIPVLRHQLAK